MKKFNTISLVIAIVLILVGNSFAQSSLVKMNEIYSRGTTADPDWIEIYNGASTSIDISNYKIYDSGGHSGTKAKKGFPSGTVIAANGFYVVVTDGTGSSDFGLSNNDEEVWLEDETGTVIDDVTFPALATGESYGRVPDGNSTLIILNTQTKGATNGSATAVENDISLTTDFKLEQNYPNPFNPTTTITFSVSQESSIRLEVYNVIGQLVSLLVDSKFSAGKYNVTWNANFKSSGLYFYKLKAIGQDGVNFTLTKKMMLLK